MQNTKKLLFTAILAVAALAASDSNSAAAPKRIRVRDQWNRNTLADVYVDPNGTILDVKQAIETEQEIPVRQQILLDNGRMELDDRDSVRDIDTVYLKLNFIPVQEQQIQPMMITSPAPRCPAEQEPEDWDEAWGSKRFWGEPRD